MIAVSAAPAPAPTLSPVPASVGEAARAAATALAFVELPRLEARLLVGHVLGIAPEIVLGHPERPLAPANAARLAELIARRKRGEPMAYILGTREFWSLPLRVTPDVLIPRPDTEVLVETALRAVAGIGRPPRIIDLGTGSGCILLALLSELPGASGIGVDRCEKALRVARDNAARLRLVRRCGFVCGDWSSAIDARFDLVVSNPPYIPDAEHDGLDAGVRLFEPRHALRGGADGLAAYRRLGNALAKLLAPGGFAVIEVGDGQAGEVSALMASRALKTREVVQDLGGRARCLRLAGQ